MSFYFISYDKHDKDFTSDILLPELRHKGFIEWKDRVDADRDPMMSNGVNSAINRSVAVLVIVSSISMTSEDVKFEWGYAHYINKPIIPIMIESPEVIGANGKLQVVYDVHEKLARLPWYNFSDSAHYEWEGLLHAMNAIQQSAQAPVTTVTMKAVDL